MPNELAEYYESDDAIVYAWDARTALVQIERWVCVLVPLAGATGKVFGDEPRARFAPLVESPPEARALIRLGELAVWASRRATESHCIVYGQVRRDAQQVLGAVYDRVAIRESLQWLFQHRVSADAIVEVESVRAYHTEACNTKAHVLRMRCGDWMAIVMCHVPGSRHGDDPLFPVEVTP